MNEASRRARRSPDRHSSERQPPDKQNASEVSRGEWYSRGYLPHREGHALTQHLTVHRQMQLGRLTFPIGHSAGGNPEEGMRRHLAFHKSKLELSKVKGPNSICTAAEFSPLLLLRSSFWVHAGWIRVFPASKCGPGHH